MRAYGHAAVTPMKWMKEGSGSVPSATDPVQKVGDQAVTV